VLGPVADGGRIVFITTPGCWGPMITPTIRGGHEVNLPVAVEKANVGDAMVIRIESIKIRSKASLSGVDRPVEGAYVGDPYVAKRCPVCREPWPDFVFEKGSVDIENIRCKKCGVSASPFRMVHGYTMVFDESYRVGLTVSLSIALEIAKNAWECGAIPPKSKQVQY